MNDLQKFAYKTGNQSNRMPIQRDSYQGVNRIMPCALCKEVKQIGSRKHNLCGPCYGWCRRWLKSKYGYYDKRKIPEAMTAFFSPVACEGCGEEIKYVKGQRRDRKRRKLCERCAKIYDKAYASLHNKPKRSGRYKYK